MSDYNEFLLRKSQLSGEYGFEATFMGVGSEVYSPVSLRRFGIGIELKETYFNQAVENLKEVKYRFDIPQLSIF